jgi:hypothetical protein
MKQYQNKIGDMKNGIWIINYHISAKTRKDGYNSNKKRIVDKSQLLHLSKIVKVVKNK